MRIQTVLPVLLAVTLFGDSAQSQQTDEPLFQTLSQIFRTRELTLGAYIQLLGDYQRERDDSEGHNGFSIPRARMRITGELDKGVGYLLQADLSRTPTITDAQIRIALSRLFAFDFGQFMVPFSGERMTSSSTLEFINRSQIVRALAPGRQVGTQLRGEIGSPGLRYNVGAFNGNSPRSLSNDNNELMYASRLAYRGNPFGTGSQSDFLEIGANALRSLDEAVSLGYEFGSTFRGERTLYGADLRLQRGRLNITAEFIGAELDDRELGTVSKPTGYQATVGYSVADRHRLGVRWDSMDADGRRSDRDLAMLAYTFFPTTPTKLMFNYVIPSGEGSRRHQILTQIQFYF